LWCSVLPSQGLAHLPNRRNGDGLRRSAIEAGGVLMTFIWDGNDYLMEKS
jgi:hypothetical protein